MLRSGCYQQRLGGLEAEGMEQTWRFQQVGSCPTSSRVGLGY